MAKEFTPIKESRKKAMFLEPVVRIGKNGITGGICEEVRMQLKKRGLVKVRVLKSALTEDNDFKRHNIRDFSELLAEKTCSELIQTIGLNIILKQKK